MDKKLITARHKFQKILIYFAWVLVLMLIVSTVKNINRVISIRKQVALEKAKVEKMQSENEKLQAQIIESQTQEFIDKQIRNRLGLMKDGETVVILPEEEIIRSMAPEMEANEEIFLDPNWMEWMKLFF